jgi:hypothetical protein
VFYVRDPDGVTIEIVERAAEGVVAPEVVRARERLATSD